MALNRLEFGSKKQSLFSIALLHAEKFREGRSETKQGRMLYNEEIRIAEQKVKQYKIHLDKPLPERMKT